MLQRHQVSLNNLCAKPLQSATDMLKHMAAHNASRAFAPTVLPMEPVAELVAKTELAPSIPAAQLLAGPGSAIPN
jgi:hypothetical protein